MAKLSAAVLAAALLLLTPTLAHAARWYQVEVIIFSQQDSYGNEKAPQGIHLHFPARVTGFGKNDFVQLTKEQRQLNADAYTLARTGVYKILFHEAWVQPGLRQGQAPWLLVSGGKPVGDRDQLEGSLKLYLNNYLHLATNLWLLQPSDAYLSPSSSLPATSGAYASTRNLPPLPGASPSGAQILRGSGYQAVPLKSIYTFEQSNRLQLGKIHYLDHPKMGILVKATRAQAPDANTSVATTPTATTPLE